MKEFLLRTATGVAGTLLLYYVEGTAGLAFSAPLWGILMAKPIVNGSWEFARLIRRSAQNRVGWELYGIGMWELRVKSIDGHPWIVANDLLQALDLDASALQNLDAQEYSRIPDRREWGISEPGVLKLIEMIDDDPARRFALQLERDMFAPLRKRRESVAVTNTGII